MRPAARTTSAIVAALLAAALGGCGLGGGAGGGDENLPTLGAGPYRKLSDPDFATPADEPYLVVDPAADLTEPAILPSPSAGGLRLLLTRTPEGGAPAIVATELASLGDLAGPLVPVLAADAPWEGGRVAAPAVLALGGELVVYYEGADGVGRAVSSDGGASFAKEGLVLPGGAAPTALLVDGEVLLYHERPPATGIFLARSPDGLGFAVEPEPVLAPRPDEPEAFDRHAVSAPFAVGGRTVAGQRRIGLFYVGAGPDPDVDRPAIGYAGSDDGVSFERFGGGVPVLEPGLVAEGGPAARLTPHGGLLLFHEPRTGRQAIAGAVHP